MKTRLLVAVVLLALLGVSGCTFSSRDPPSTRILQVSMDDVRKQSVITQDITLSVGNTLVVKLASNYTTPFRWTPTTQVGDSTIVKQVDHRFVQPTTDALGASGTEEWTFDVLKSGTTTITTSYASILGKDRTPTCTYTATVTVL